MFDRFGIAADACRGKAGGLRFCRLARREGRRPAARNQGPAPGILDAEQAGAPVGAAASPTALGRRYEQRAQSGKAVGVDEAAGDQLAERLLEFDLEQMRTLGDFVEERRAIPAQVLEHGGGTRRGVRGLAPARCGEPAPQGQCATWQQNDRRAAHRTRGALAIGRAGRGETRPDDAPAAALLVEPVDRVVGQARRQHLGLPGRGRAFEALELGQHAGQRIGAARPHARRQPVPVEQEAHEVARLDRFDLATQALERIAMDAREQVAFAPLLDFAAWTEATAHRRALGFEREQGLFDLPRTDMQRCCERVDRDRSQCAQPRAQRFDQRIVLRPRNSRIFRRRRNRGLHRRTGMNSQELAEAFGSDPQRLADPTVN